MRFTISYSCENESKERIIYASNCINGRLLWKPFKEMQGLEWYNDAAAEEKKKSVLLMCCCIALDI